MIFAVPDGIGTKIPVARDIGLPTLRFVPLPGDTAEPPASSRTLSLRTLFFRTLSFRTLSFRTLSLRTLSLRTLSLRTLSLRTLSLRTEVLHDRQRGPSP